MSLDLSLLAGWPVICEQRVAWGEMDCYGHVNNTIYFRYMENARLEYFRRLGWQVGQRPAGIGPILHTTQCRFRKALTWPDSIAIGARVPKVDSDRFTIEHLIISEQQGLAAEGWGLIVTFDYAAGEKAAVPDDLRRRIDRLEGRMES
jgi:acyl-CoA thioester hydrolase